MKYISMILTSNCSESCNRKVLSKNLVIQEGRVKNFGMASAACVPKVLGETSHFTAAHRSPELFRDY